MDVLYLLGRGSPFNNEELKYSLRSLYRYGKNIDRLILVGEKPDFLDYSEVIHLPFDEKGVKDYRIASKILHACDQGILEGDFLFCNDDFFFTRPFDCDAFPYYHKGLLRYPNGGIGYQEHLKITQEFLSYHGKSIYHFDVHCPIIYNAQKFQSLREVWKYSSTTIGLVVKSIYANMHGIKGEMYNDAKLKQLLPNSSEWYAAFENECFSIYDEAWGKGVRTFLEERFPTRSIWEL